MNESYQRCIEQWNEIYAAESDRVPKAPSSGNEAFDRGLRWLAEGGENVLDFGCGNGSALFFCALLGTKHHIGIDLSTAAVENAIKRSRNMTTGEFTFWEGGMERLSELAADSMDAVVLCNIVDNLYPVDAETVFTECARILKSGGKALIKLNPFLTEQQITQWGIRVIEGSLLDDGLLLWNNTTEQWRALFERFFNIEHYEEIYYPEHEQTNRMFGVRKR
ncbi:MAG: class I SAM-dependent methyltransferase [Clostridiaceae bacterium]